MDLEYGDLARFYHQASGTVRVAHVSGLTASGKGVYFNNVPRTASPSGVSCYIVSKNRVVFLKKGDGSVPFPNEVLP